MLIPKENFFLLIWNLSRRQALPRSNGLTFNKFPGMPATISRRWPWLKITSTSLVSLEYLMDQQRFSSSIVRYPSSNKVMCINFFFSSLVHAT